MAQSLHILKKIDQIIDALNQFPNRQNNLFNISKLAQMLHLSEEEIKNILNIIFKLQTQFSTIFKNYWLQESWKNGITYLTLTPKQRIQNRNKSLKEVELNTDHSQLLSDIIYYFQHVKIGKGFNIHANATGLSKKVNELFKTHPYLFESRGNGLMYPTKLALEIGKQLHSYNNSNRNIPNLQIDEYLVTVR